MPCGSPWFLHKIAIVLRPCHDCRGPHAVNCVDNPMKPGNAPKTLEDLLRLVDEAIFEAEDVLNCAEEEGETDQHFTRVVPVATTLRAELRKLRADLASGQVEPGTRKD